MKFLRILFDVLCCGVLVIATCFAVMLMMARPAFTDPDPEIIRLLSEPTMTVEEARQQKAEATANLVTVATDSGATPEEVILNLSRQDYESAVTFDHNGIKIADVTSNYESKVRLTAAWWQDFQENDGAIVIHNHPEGRSFSAQDLYAAALSRVPVMVVVTQQYVFIVKNIATGDSIEEAADKANALITYCDERRNWWREHVTTEAFASGMPIQVYMSHEVVTEAAHRFGFEYYYVKLADIQINQLSVT